MNSWQIVAYTYQAEILCPGCTQKKVYATHLDSLSPAAQDLTPEVMLDQLAEYLLLDREEEHGFDSDDFPKLVLASQVDEAEDCGECGEAIV